MERSRLVLWGVYGVFAIIACRAVMLHLFPSAGASLHNIADNQYQRNIELAPYRGTIYDRRGDPLAISIHRPSLAVNPRIFAPNADELARLSHILHISRQRINSAAKRKNYFAWLQRQVDHRVADEAMALGIKGMSQVREPTRFYPAGPAAAHVLGFIGIDNTGLGGLERQFDRDLRGQPLTITASKDAHGNFIFNETSDALPEKTGNSIHLTIDRVIQEITEDELVKGLKKARAKKGFAIVSDPHTGRILAMANYPRFDPNKMGRVQISDTRNQALVDTFEPGSVTKPFLIASALDQGITKLDEEHDCENGALRIGRATIHDTHPSDKLTTVETIINSSNICTFKIAQKMGKQKTYDALQGFGIGARVSGLGFPGESYGYLAPSDKWRTIRFANVAFGHGFVTTGLELVQAMGALANGGNLMKPTLIDRIVSSDGLVVTSTPPKVARRVINPAIARELRGILREVVENKHGTGSKAKTSLYTTAGKTGTAQKVDPGIRGYAKDKYIASFLGFAPVSDPHLVIYVFVDEPREKPYYGGVWAAPIFAAVAERSLKYLNVAPDLEPKSDGAPKPPLAGMTRHADSNRL